MHNPADIIAMTQQFSITLPFSSFGHRIACSFQSISHFRAKSLPRARVSDMSILSCMCRSRKNCSRHFHLARFMPDRVLSDEQTRKVQRGSNSELQIKTGPWIGPHPFLEKISSKSRVMPSISLGLIWFRLAENVIGTLLVHRNKTSSEMLAHKCILCRNTKTFYLGQGSKASSSDSESFKLLKRPGPDFRTGDETRSRKKSGLRVSWLSDDKIEQFVDA